jgi:hypothetical protein
MNGVPRAPQGTACPTGSPATTAIAKGEIVELEMQALNRIIDDLEDEPEQHFLLHRSTNKDVPAAMQWWAVWWLAIDINNAIDLGALAPEPIVEMEDVNEFSSDYDFISSRTMMMVTAPRAYTSVCSTAAIRLGFTFVFC